MKKPILFLSRAHLQAIGNLAAHWAYLESIVEIAIWAFLNIDDRRGRALTTHIGMVSRCQAIVMLLYERHPKHPELRKPMEDLLGRIDPLRVKRNDIIHNLWKFDKKASVALGLKYTAKGEVRKHHRNMSADEISGVTHDTHDLVCEMMGLLEAMFPNRRFPWQ